MGTLSVDKLVKTSQGAAEFTLPATDGAAGTVLQTDGSGQLSLANYTGPIATDAVGSSQIAANAVTTTEIVDDAVTLAKLAATGTASATTFLRGDNTWAVPTDNGKVLQVVSTTKTDVFTVTGTAFVDITGFSAAITPSATTSKVLIHVSISCGADKDTFVGFKLLRGATTVAEGDTDATAEEVTFGTVFVDVTTEKYRMMSVNYNFLDSPSTTSATTYKVQVSPMRAASRQFYLNRTFTISDANQMVSTSTITVMEIGA